MKRKTFAILTALVLMFAMFCPAFAAEINDPSEEELDATLAQRGYPESMLNEINISQKLELYRDPDMNYVDSFTISYDEPANNSNSGIQPYGQISTSDLSLSFYISRSLNDDNTLNKIFVQYSYNWKNIPVFRFEDCIAVSWNGDKFKMVDDTFYKVDKYSGTYVDANGDTAYITDEYHSSDTGYARGSADGVSWYADLKGNTGTLIVTKLNGYGSFRLEPQPDVTIPVGTTTTFYGHYVHPTVSIGASITIPGVGDFSVSGGGAYDERGSQRTFTISE